jgi:hypothetical protein
MAELSPASIRHLTNSGAQTLTVAVPLNRHA